MIVLGPEKSLWTGISAGTIREVIKFEKRHLVS